MDEYAIEPLAFDLALTDPRHPMHVGMMALAIEQAELAALNDEVPVGCVIFHPQHGVVAAAYNQKEKLNDPTAHAEMIAITQAANMLNDWRLEGCLLYVTLEPCPMCAGAIVQARVPYVAFGASDLKAGACESLYQITNDQRLNHRCKVIGGVSRDICAELLSTFFAKKRAMGKK